MKKFLLFIFTFICCELYSQDYTTTVIRTNTLSTSKMIWNYTENKWDFVSNNDLSDYPCNWTFNIDSTNRGMISAGNIKYDILSFVKVNDSSIFMS